MGYQDALATHLRMCRAKLGITQERVASEVGIGQDALSQYERGERTPTFANVIRLADYYHVSTDYLVGRDTSN
jgi:transcriptional regulator with XRE-family HTH domain